MILTTRLNPETTALLQTIAKEAEAVQQFVDLLKLEQEELSHGKVDNLPSLAEKKNLLALHLNDLSSKRNTSLAAQGFSADRSGIEAWCKSQPTNDNASKIWFRILSLAEEARELNRLNGVLIGMHMQHNAKALEVLLRNRSPLNLYGPDGQTQSPGNGRINDAA